MARPKTGETPIRHVRVSDELWGKVGDVARQQDKTVSAAVVVALEKYVAEELGESPGRDQNGTIRRGTRENEAG
jgi:predicted transcriptional regulator